jgi:hypothetical protein
MKVCDIRFKPTFLKGKNGFQQAVETPVMAGFVVGVLGYFLGVSGPCVGVGPWQGNR